MPIALIVLGFGLVAAGIYFAVGGLATDNAHGTALKGISVQGPSWLILVALGVGTIIFGAWQFEDKGQTAPPKEEEAVVTVAPDEEEPFDYGDDPELDNLWEGCFEGEWGDCDELYLLSPFDSEYEWFGATCGGIIGPDELFCEEVPPGQLLQAQEDGKLPHSD